MSLITFIAHPLIHNSTTVEPCRERFPEQYINSGKDSGVFTEMYLNISENVAKLTLGRMLENSRMWNQVEEFH